MLRLQDVSLMRGVRVLYSHATLLANPGERIGLVGENGCGKSSLLAAILGEVPLEAGEIAAPAPENIRQMHSYQKLLRLMPHQSSSTSLAAPQIPASFPSVASANFTFLFAKNARSINGSLM